MGYRYEGSMFDSNGRAGRYHWHRIQLQCTVLQVHCQSRRLTTIILSTTAPGVPATEAPAVPAVDVAAVHVNGIQP